ncbi:MAG: hypothetical protein ACYSYL_21595 [Planctomycetota bacterium]
MSEKIWMAVLRPNDNYATTVDSDDLQHENLSDPIERADNIVICPLVCNFEELKSELRVLGFDTKELDLYDSSDNR